MAGESSRVADLALGEAPPGVSSRTLPRGLHPLAGNRTELLRRGDLRSRAFAQGHPSRQGCWQPCHREGVESQPMAIFTEWVRRCTRWLTVDERAAWRDPPPPSQTRSTESVAAGPAASQPLVMPSLRMARLHRRAARLATPPLSRRRLLRRASCVGRKKAPGTCASAPGVFPKPVDGRRALRQGRPKAVVGGRNLTRSGRPHRLAGSYHQSRSQARECERRDDARVSVDDGGRVELEPGEAGQLGEAA